MKANFPALALALLLAGCATAPKPVPRPAPPPPMLTPVPSPPTPAPPPAPADWRDAPQSPGDWRWSREGALSVARYGPPPGVLFSLTCDPARRTITLRRLSFWKETTPITVTTTSGTRTLDGQPEATTPPTLAVALSANDPLLDAMAFSRGRFMVEAQGIAPLYLPSWAEVSRVIEDCR